MAYFTEAELEAHTGRTFTTTSRLTSTQIGTMATEISAMYDGLAQQTEGTETPDEFVKQACLSVATFRVNQIYNGEAVDPEREIRIFKEFLTPIHKKTLYYSQEYPDRAGEW